MALARHSIEQFSLKLAERAVQHVVIDKKPRRRAQRQEVEGARDAGHR